MSSFDHELPPGAPSCPGCGMTPAEMADDLKRAMELAQRRAAHRNVLDGLDLAALDGANNVPIARVRHLLDGGAL